MQEDAHEMTLEEFIEKHGKSQEAIWHEVWDEADYSVYDDGV